MKKKVVRLEYVMNEGQNLVGTLNTIVGSINEGKPQGNIPVYQLTATDWITVETKPVDDAELDEALRDLTDEAETVIKPQQDKQLLRAITGVDKHERY